MISTYLLPHIFRYIAKSQELLFVLSIAWSFLVSIFSYSMGLSIEIGAFLAGLSLAYLPYTYEIVARVKSLRDFFLILFFVALGTYISPGILSNFVLIGALSLSVLIIQPILIMIILGVLGYSKRTSFMTGIALAQVSEFSLVIAGMGLSLGHLTPEIVSLITVVAIVTITFSTYYVTFADKLFHIFKKYLTIFERRELKEHTIPVELKIKDHVVVVGHHVMGSRITQKLRELKKKVIVVDFDPDVVCDINASQEDSKTQCLYGDIEDVEVLERVGLAKASMLVSTVPNLRTNLFLTKTAKKMNPKIIVLVATGETKDAFDLYAAGADYVILPYVLGGEHSSILIQKIEEDRGHLKLLKEKHLNELRKDANFYSFL
jgi:voltage-gated potassium channel Kch